MSSTVIRNAKISIANVNHLGNTNVQQSAKKRIFHV